MTAFLLPPPLLLHPYNLHPHLTSRHDLRQSLEWAPSRCLGVSQGGRVMLTFQPAGEEIPLHLLLFAFLLARLQQQQQQQVDEVKTVASRY